MAEKTGIKRTIRDRIKQRLCSHEFQLKDLRMTGIPEPEKPENNDPKRWSEYFKDVYHGESATKRVKWPCSKCKRVFHAHCGLDIAPAHGPIVANTREEGDDPLIDGCDGYSPDIHTASDGSRLREGRGTSFTGAAALLIFRCCTAGISSLPKS